MKIPANTPRRAITVQGLTLQAPAPYTEGHTLIANEAAVLNQTLAENLRNNFASVVAKAVKDAGVKDVSELPAEKTSALQAEFDKYVETYEFGVHRSGVRVVDPIEREAIAIAEEAIKTALRQRNLKVTGEGGVGKEKFNELVAQFAGREDIRKEAERRVKNASKISLGDLLGGGGQ